MFSLVYRNSIRNVTPDFVKCSNLITRRINSYYSRYFIMNNQSVVLNTFVRKRKFVGYFIYGSDEKKKKKICFIYKIVSARKRNISSVSANLGWYESYNNILFIFSPPPTTTVSNVIYVVFMVWCIQVLLKSHIFPRALNALYILHKQNVHIIITPILVFPYIFIIYVCARIIL